MDVINRNLTKKWFALFYMFFWVIIVTGQNASTDSLKKVLSQTTDGQDKVKTLILLSSSYKGKNDSLALLYIHSAINDAEHLNFSPELAKAYQTKGRIYSDTRKYQEAIAPLEQSVLLFKKIKNTRKLSAVLNDLGLAYHHSGNPDKATKFISQALEIDESLNDSTAMAKALANLAVIKQAEGKSEEAIAFLERTKDIDSLTKQWNYYVEDLGSISTCYKTLKQYDKALSYAIRGYALADSLDATTAIHQLTGTIGDIYQSLGDYESSEEYLKISLEKAKHSRYTNLLGAAYARLQLHYQMIGKPQLSICFFDSALLYISPTSKPILYNNIGQLYENQLDDIHTAINYYKEAIKTAREVSNKPLEVSPLFNLGFALKKQGKKEEALQYMNQGLLVRDTTPLQINVYRRIADVYYSVEDYKKGYELILEANLMQDSLLKIKEKAQSQLLSYEKQIRELKIQEKAAQVKEQKYGLFAMSACLLFLLLFAYQRYQIAKTQKEKQEETALMSAEMHHRTRNNLATFSSIIFIKGHEIEDLKARDVISSIRDRIIALEEIHSLLYKKNNALKTEVKSFLEALINKLVMLNSSNDDNVTVHFNIDGNKHQIESSHAIEIGKVVNEVITNAFKYSIKDSPHPEITILGKIERSYLSLIISNNGHLLPEDFNINELNSFGLKWVKGICDNMGWEFTSTNLKNKVAFKFGIPLVFSEK